MAAWRLGSLEEAGHSMVILDPHLAASVARALDSSSINHSLGASLELIGLGLLGEAGTPYAVNDHTSLVIPGCSSELARFRGTEEARLASRSPIAQGQL